MPTPYPARAARIAPAPWAWLAEILSAPFARARPAHIAAPQQAADRGLDPADLLIRERLLAQLQHQAGWNSSTANVFVKDGVVILQGLIQRNEKRRTVQTLARSVPHVRAIRDDRVPAREWQAMA